MKNTVIAIGAFISMIGTGLIADEIDSGVIHNYRYIGAGYGYLHDIADIGIDGHGAVGQFSFEEANVLFGVSGGYYWVDDSPFEMDINVWEVAPSLGYVIRLAENRINLIPRVAGAYTEVVFGDPVFGFEDSEGSWSILPGATLSFALNNHLAINGGYTYGYNFETEEDDHLFHAGAKVAVLEKIGLAVNANFSKEFGFTGITGMVQFHF